MRLVNSSFLAYGLFVISGIVQVCVNQWYGYICADNWDDREADVVCRSLSNGYKAPYYGMDIYSKLCNSVLRNCDCIIENTASTTSLVFGDAPIYRYSMCNGTEYNFSRCQLPRSNSNSVCSSIGIVNCTEGTTK